MSKFELSKLTFKDVTHDVKPEDIGHACLCALWVSVPPEGPKTPLGDQFGAEMISIYEAFLVFAQEAGKDDIKHRFNMKVAQKSELNDGGRGVYPWKAPPWEIGTEDPDVALEWLTLIAYAALELPYFFKVKSENSEARMSIVEQEFKRVTEKYNLDWKPSTFRQAFDDAKRLASGVPK